MRAYLATRITQHLAKTPEGFLLAPGVAICRTGWQDYHPQELGLSGNSLIRVYRPKHEVLSERTVASAEGKCITDGHPPVPITPNNVAAYHCGHMQNVRPSNEPIEDGEWALLADLVIMNGNLIATIESGVRRELSLGYETQYSQDSDGNWQQSKITINHLSVVENARAGRAFRIKDSRRDSMKDEQFNDADILLRLDRLTSLLIAYFGGDRREPWQRDSDSAGRVVAGNWRRRDETTAHSTLGESHALEAFLKRNPSAVELHEFFDKQYREHNRVTQQAVDGARSDDSFAAAMNAAGRAMRDGRDCRSNLRKNARDASESWEQAMNRRGRELREGR